MAEISKFKDRKTDTVYDIKDAQARADLQTKQDIIESVNVNYEENGGNPGASAELNNGELNFTMQNMKLKFSDLTEQEKENLKGEKGDQGDSAVYDPNDPNVPDFEMTNTTGDSTTKTMTQKAITECLDDINYYVKKDINIKDSITFRNGYIAKNGLMTTDNVWKFGVVKLKSGQTIKAYSDITSGYPIIGVAESENVSIGDSVTIVSGNSYEAEEETVVVVVAKTLNSSRYLLSQDGNLVDYIEQKYDSVNNRADEVEKDIEAIKGVKNYIDAGVNAQGNIYSSEYRLTPKVLIPVEYNDEITWVYNEGAYALCCAQELAEDQSTKTTITWQSKSNDGGQRTFNISQASTKYLRIDFVKKDGFQPKLYVNGELVFEREDDGSISLLSERVQSLEDSLIPSDSQHGVIGENYPEQMYDVNVLLNAKLSNRFHFIHISDNHGGNFGYAEDFLDYSQAKFLVNTGDLVLSSFSDSKSTLLECATKPQKPVYLVLGNHDYSYATSKEDVFSAFFGDENTEGTVNYHNANCGGVSVDKSYYSIDFDTEKIKCIMLDMNDGWDSYSSVGPYNATHGKMSQTQINWFVAELQDALTQSYHVCVFIHTLPYLVDSEKNIPEFCDFLGGGMGVESNLTFLPKIVDAFQKKSSVEFSYNGNDYSFSFSTAGHFVAWFCGHTHWDIAGKMSQYPDQWMIHVCRPRAESYEYQSTYDGNKLGVHWNYVTVDRVTKSVSVYRIGQQDTIYATKRKSFRLIYQ